MKEGGKFRTSMVGHEMKHKKMRAQNIFATANGLKGKLATSFASGCAKISNDGLGKLSPGPKSIGNLPRRLTILSLKTGYLS